MRMVGSKMLDSEIADFLSGRQTIIRDPYPFYKRLRDEGPVYWYKGKIPFVTRYKDATALFSNVEAFQTYRSRERFGLDRLADEDRARVDAIGDFEEIQLNQTNGALHKRIRSVAQRVFPSGKFTEMRPTVRMAVNQLLDDTMKHDVADMMDFAYRLPLTVITAFFGLPANDIDKLKSWGDAIATAKPFVDGGLPLEVIRAAHAAVESTEQYVKGMIEDSRRNPGKNGFMDALLAAETGDQLSEHELSGLISLLIYASHESSTNMLGNGLHSLLSHRDQWDLLRQDPSLSNKAVMETLRFNAPVQMMTRRAAVPTQIGGVDIPYGAEAIILYGSANRDEREYEDPDRLDITRSKMANVSFGFGVHVCIGAALARLEGQIAFEVISQRFPEAKLADELAEPEWKPHPLFRGLRRLPVRLGPDKGPIE